MVAASAVAVDSLDAAGMIEAAVSVVSIESVRRPELEVLSGVELLLGSDSSVEAVVVVVALVVVRSSLVVTAAKVDPKLFGDVDVDVSESNSESEIAGGLTEAV